MQVTLEALQIGAQRAESCGQNGFARTLRSMADWMQLDNGRGLSQAQLDYAESILERYTDDAYDNLVTERNQIRANWEAKDADWVKWIEFLTCFYVSGNCRSNTSHVQWYSMNARVIREALQQHITGIDTKCPVEDIIRLQGSKLAPNLRECFDSEPKYAVGDLVSIRGNGEFFQAYRCITYGFDKQYRYGMPTHQARKVRQPYKTALVSEVLNATFACRSYHKTKGSTRLYRITAFSGGQQDDCWVEEDRLKLLK